MYICSLHCVYSHHDLAGLADRTIYPRAVLRQQAAKYPKRASYILPIIFAVFICAGNLRVALVLHAHDSGSWRVKLNQALLNVNTRQRILRFALCTRTLQLNFKIRLRTRWIIVCKLTVKAGVQLLLRRVQKSSCQRSLAKISGQK